MSSANDILAELSRRGVKAQADGETLRLKPRALLDDALLARVKAHKPEILLVLSGRPADCLSACYEAPQKMESVCWHCNGQRSCSCIACWHQTGPGLCAVCKGIGKVRRWLQ
jgi:hypothetical protein